MRRDQAIQLLRSRTSELRGFHVQSLSLFGSVARDEAEPGSDLDVLVEFAGDPTFEDYVGLVLFLEELVGSRVDVLTRDGLKPRAREQIERDLVHVA